MTKYRCENCKKESDKYEITAKTTKGCYFFCSTKCHNVWKK
ncbi:MAG: hypothetical protein Q7S22_04640 [Candidatus Micrarchaeota archaeon]|nr:hypothetical protein [Candidatus Micrarchaeota archaeon]